MKLLIDALGIGGLLLVIAGVGLWQIKRVGRFVCICVALAGLAVLAAGIGLHVYNRRIESRAAAVVDILRPLIKVTAEIGGDVMQSPDGNYVALMQLTTANVGDAPANAMVVIQPVLETGALKDAQKRMLDRARKAGVSGGDAIFVGQPERGPVEEVPIPAGAVKITPLPAGGGYTVTLPPLLVIGTYAPLIKGAVHQTSFAVRLHGTAPPPSPNSMILLPKERIEITPMPELDHDE